MSRQNKKLTVLERREWDIRQEIVKRIEKAGGWVNTHTHLDRAYTIDLTSLELGNAHLHQKWGLVDEIKRRSSVDEIYDRMAYALEEQVEQGVGVVGSFIDVDSVVEDKALRAAEKIRDKNKSHGVRVVFINQTLKGVLEPEARKWFELGAEFVDIIGGLPGRDRWREDEHVDVVLGTAKKLNKMAHVHVDQLNMEREKETELLVKKTMEHKMEGRVVAIHGISIAAQRFEYRHELYRKMRQAGVGVICCPTAWIDSRRSEELTVTHNSIAPVEELVAAGMVVGLGTDNIADVYKPFTDGDMWTELRFLLESCHYYDLDELVKIGSSNGRKILGVN